MKEAMRRSEAKGYRTQHHVHLETSTHIIDFHIGDRVWWEDHQGVKLKGTIMQFNALGRGEILAIIKPDIAGTYGMARPVSILNRIVEGLEGLRVGEDPPRLGMS